MPRTTATVEALTAQVRVLMVGSRQITLSVYWQLDDVDSDKVDVFGRVAPSQAEEGWTYAVGRHKESGDLVRCRVITSRQMMEKILYDEDAAIKARKEQGESYRRLAAYKNKDVIPTDWTGMAIAAEEEVAQRTAARAVLEVKMETDAVVFENLPLIVLAGLR